MPVYDENSMLAMWPVYRKSNKTLIEWPEKTSWTNMLDLVWNKNALHEPDSKDSQTAWRQEWTYHASVSGGNKFTGSGLIKFTKKGYLIRSQLSLILALPLSHFTCLMLKSMLSTLRWLLLVCLGIFFISCLFLGGIGYLKLQTTMLCFPQLSSYPHCMERMSLTV